MRHSLVALLLSIFLFGACFNKKPKNILSEKKMTELLTEVHLVDGYLLNLPVDTSKKYINSLYNQLFDKYGIDSAKFVENIDFYYSNPKLTSKMYEKIHEKLYSYEKMYMIEDSIRFKFQTDSLNQVAQYQKQLSIHQQLLNFYPNPHYLFNYSQHRDNLFSGLDGYVWRPIFAPGLVYKESKGKGSHFDRLLQIRNQLLKFEADSNFVDSYGRNNESFYKPTGLYFLWKRPTWQQQSSTEQLKFPPAIPESVAPANIEDVPAEEPVEIPVKPEEPLPVQQNLQIRKPVRLRQ